VENSATNESFVHAAEFGYCKLLVQSSATLLCVIDPVKSIDYLSHGHSIEKSATYVPSHPVESSAFKLAEEVINHPV